jgi:hypothetical protein
MSQTLPSRELGLSQSLNVLGWEEACKLNPKLKSGLAQVAAE